MIRLGKILKIILFGIVSLSLLCPTVISEAVPPPTDCIVYGYFSEPQHSSFLASDSFHFGDSLTLISNCEVEVFHNQNAPLKFSNYTVLNMGEGVHTLKLSYENRTQSFDNVIVITSTNMSQMLGQNDLLKYDRNSLHFSQTDYQSEQAMIGAFSGLITWAIVTYGLWFIINKYQSRFMFEEVTQ